MSPITTDAEFLFLWLTCNISRRKPCATEAQSRCVQVWPDTRALLMLLQLQGEKLPGSRPASQCILLWRRKGFSLSQSNSCSIDTGLTEQIQSHQLVPALTSVGTERLNTAVRMKQMFSAADFFTPEISPNYKSLWCWAIQTSFKSTWLRMWQDLVNRDQVPHHINENI